MLTTRFPASPDDITVVDGEVAKKTMGEGYVKLGHVPFNKVT